jgi:hypothetical protein
MRYSYCSDKAEIEKSRDERKKIDLNAHLQINGHFTVHLKPFKLLEFSGIAFFVFFYVLM